MTETTEIPQRALPPESPTPIKKDPREISDLRMKNAQIREKQRKLGLNPIIDDEVTVHADDTEKGMYGLTQKDRLEMGKVWLKAHDELDPNGKDINKETTIPEKKGIKTIPSRLRNFLRRKEPKTQTDYVDPQKIIESRQKDEKLFNTNLDYNQWLKELSPVGKKIVDAVEESAPLVLTETDTLTIKQFIESLQRLLMTKPDFKDLLNGINNKTISLDSLPADKLSSQLYLYLDSQQVVEKLNESQGAQRFDPNYAYALNTLLLEALDLFPSQPIQD